MFKRITILIFIIGIIFLIIGIWLTSWNNSRTGKLDLREKAVATSEDYWSDSMVIFRYNSMKLQIANLEDQLEDRDILMQELLIEKLSREYSEKLIVVLADYIKFMQALCDANGLIYPALVVEEIDNQSEAMQLKDNEITARWAAQEDLENEVKELEMVIANRDEYIRQLEEGLIK